MDTPPFPPPPPPPPPAPPPPPPPPAPAAKGSNRTLIVILCIVGAIVLIIGGCVFTCVHYVRKGARRLQDYSEVARKNPQLAALELAAAIHPDLQIVSKDEDAGKITLRNTKTGQVVTLDLNQMSADRMGQAMEQLSRGVKPAAAVAQPEEETQEEPARPARRSTPTVTSARTTALAATLRKFPDFIPVYRGATTVGATMNSFGGNVVGNYAFTTDDPPETAAGFYEKRLTSAGFNIISKQNDSNDNGPTITFVAQDPSSQTTATCKAEIEGGRTHVEVDFVKAGGG